MASILQGTTPTLTLNIDTDELTVSSIDTLEMVIYDEGDTLTKGLDDVTLDTTNNAISYTFTEAETLAFTAQTNLKLQCRFKVDDTILGTEIYRIKVKDLISEDTI